MWYSMCSQFLPLILSFVPIPGHPQPQLSHSQHLVYSVIFNPKSVISNPNSVIPSSHSVTSNPNWVISNPTSQSPPIPTQSFPALTQSSPTPTESSPIPTESSPIPTESSPIPPQSFLALTQSSPTPCQPMFWIALNQLLTSYLWGLGRISTQTESLVKKTVPYRAPGDTRAGQLPPGTGSRGWKMPLCQVKIYKIILIL